MHTTESDSQLLHEIGAALGIEGLSFDEDGLCILSIDEMPVAIQVRESGWQLSGFVAEVAEAEENEELTLSVEQWRALLEINHALMAQGTFATLTYDKQTECVLFTQPLLQHEMQAWQIVSALENFIFRLEEVQRLVDDIKGPNTLEDPTERSDEAMAMLGRIV